MSLKMLNYGIRLKSERERLNMSQVKLAEICDVTKTTQSNYENDLRAPDLVYLSKAAEVGMDVQYVITGEHCEKTLDDKSLEELREMTEALLNKIDTLQKGLPYEFQK